jgi:hypothetical protein
MYIGNQLRLKHGQVLDVIEIEISSYCNLGCTQCDRNCGQAQAPTNEKMSVEQIAKFIEQSIKTRKRWYKIRVLGGEPTLHPDWLVILERLRKYRDGYSPYTTIELVTNGYGPVVTNRLPLIPADIEIVNTAKTTPLQPDFCTYAVAPCDLPEYQDADYATGCIIPEICGMALTRYGYYTCGAGASVDRVFGMGLGILNLADVTKKQLLQTRTRLCRYCGHFKSSNTDLHISHSWQNAYEAYAKQRPVLPLF